MMLRMPSRHRIAWFASVIFAAAIPLAAAILPGHFLSFAQGSKGSAGASSEAIRLNNLGVAYMDRQETEKGLESFQKATAAHPHQHASNVQFCVFRGNKQDLGRVACRFCGVEQLGVDAKVFDGKGASIVEKPLLRVPRWRYQRWEGILQVGLIKRCLPEPNGPHL